MKFSSSDRIFHDIKYNPPSNYYNLDKKQNKKVISGSLAGPKIVDQTKNTFTYSKRFEQIKDTLGPGQYFDKKKQIIYDFKKDLSNPKTFLKNTFRNLQQNPSIPYKTIDQQNLDEQDKIFIRELDLLQNLTKASQNVHKKDPSYSFAKSPRKILPQIAENKKSNKSQISKSNNLNSDFERISEKEEFETISEDKQNKKSQSGEKALVTVNETIRKASKKRNQIINSISSDFVPSLELIDLMSKMRTKYAPGPGFYNPKNNSFNNEVEELIQKSKKGAIFSSVKRFDTDKKNFLGPGSYEIHNQSFSKKGGLMGKQKRAILNLKQKKDLQYRFYINPDSDSKNTAIQRSSSCATFRKRNIFESNQTGNGFGSSIKRFSAASSLSKDQDKRSQVSEYDLQKRKNFKIQLKARLKKLNTEDRRSTKEDSGLLGISTMATLID